MKGFAIAFVLAFVLGMARALLPASGKYYEYMVQFFRNVPPLSMIPLLILWCGIGETTKTVIIVLASFFPMYLNIVKGFTGCDRKLLEVGDMFGYSRGRKFLRIRLDGTCRLMPFRTWTALSSTKYCLCTFISSIPAIITGSFQ